MKKALASLLLTAFCAVGLLPTPARAQSPTGEENRATVIRPDREDVSPPLREIAPKRHVSTNPEHELKRLPAQAAGGQDTLAATGTSTSAATTVSGLNFDGVGIGGGYTPDAAPPDTNGAVGATQYVQWVNEDFAVYDKATGARIYGPAAGNTLWSGFGGPCQSFNDGDPIAQYDKVANRWVMTQFAVSAQPYTQCIAVSDTPDATGTYHRYSFNYGRNFNDYPKLGVWPDGYYITYNMFRNGRSFIGSQVCAIDRAAILGQVVRPVTQQCVQLSSSFGGVLPADQDGLTTPPAGAPEVLLNFGTNSLNLWRYHVDWSNTANTKLTGPTNLPVAAFTRACGGGTCVPQVGTTQQLDSLADRLMYRLAYRNFGDHESLVVNHSVATSGSSGSGVRWYELRSVTAGTPVVFQQGTFAPDTQYRWMGSMAMDKVGNIAVGYSRSSSTAQPSIYFTARNPADPAGTMSLAETTIVIGGGSQLPTLARWGDYSSLSVDPVDDCTMWYTTEYLKQNGTFNWSTRVGTFKITGCQ
ncbi:MAG: hypothetical protein ABR563_17515 [Pyrinomonadaceae bacterium]